MIDEDGWEWIVPGKDEIHRYKCWFRYLQHSNRKAWLPFVYEDFGDVCQTDFETWWATHDILFKRPKQFVIDDIKTQKKFLLYESDGSLESGDIAAIAVHLYWPKLRIKKEFDKWLKKNHHTKKGTRPFDDMANEYQLHREPDTYMLNMALDTYLAVNKDKENPANKSRSNSEILLAVRRIKKPKNGKALTQLNIETHERTVNRLIRIAEEVLANVVFGKFPVYKVS